MSEIREILAELVTVEGVRGAAVLTTDGIVVASELGDDFSDDVVVGLSSFLVATTARSLREAGMGTFHRFTLNATHGTVVLCDFGEAFVVAMTDQFADLQKCSIRVQETAAALRRVVRIEI